MNRLLRVSLACAAGIGIMAAAGCASPAPPPAAGPAPPAAPFPVGRIVDLSHTYDAQTIVWPTSEKFRLETVSDGVTEAGYYYSANNFFSAEHGGTHLDAPVHFAQGRQTVDHIPLDRLVGPAVVIDVGASAASNADYQITVEDIQSAETADGAIPAGSIVVFRTGYSRRWPDAGRYLGTAERGTAGVARLHFPGLHPDAARWLVANRSIKAVGIDTASIDYGQSSLYESHRVLFERDVPAFENLAALDELPPRGATIVALPMKIGGGSGAPLRAIAILP
jgi:kynurenine formamidase